MPSPSRPSSGLIRLHALAGTGAIALILLFQTATLLAEAFAPAATIATVKSTIAWTMPALVALLATAGASGARLARGRSSALLARKQRRMRLAAANGILVLVPSALLLARWSAAGAFGPAFTALQALEIAAGLVNLALLLANFRDGLRLRPRARPRPAA